MSEGDGYDEGNMERIEREKKTNDERERERVERRGPRERVLRHPETPQGALRKTFLPQVLLSSGDRRSPWGLEGRGEGPPLEELKADLLLKVLKAALHLKMTEVIPFLDI